jgi:hypothetical protein
MAAEKKFFRVRLSSKCPAGTKIVNGVTLTKQWQVKVGTIGDFSKFPDVEAQVMVKQGNNFIPAEDASGGSEEEADGSQNDNADAKPPGGGQTANAGSIVDGSANIPDFADMTVEQLKNFLIAKGVTQSELRNATKPELVERAEFIWSQSK